MSKKSILAVVLALCLVFVGTGYAYWTDTLNITTKATTGDLDVTFLDLGYYAQFNNDEMQGWSIIDGIEKELTNPGNITDGSEGWVGADYFARGASDYNALAAPGTIEGYLSRISGYSSVEFSAELVNPVNLRTPVGPYNPSVHGQIDSSDNIVFSVENIYPGYAQAFRTDIANVGTIAAKLSRINVDVKKLEGFDNSAATKNLLGIAMHISREYQGNEDVVEVFKFANALQPADFFTVGGVDFIRLSALDKVTTSDFTNANLLAIPEENRMDVVVGIAMDPDAEGVYTTGSTAELKKNDDSKSQNKGAQVSIDLLWDQFNVNGTDATPNILEDQNVQ